MKKNRIIIISVSIFMLIIVGGLSAMCVKNAKDYGYASSNWSFNLFGGSVELRNTIELPVSQAEDLTVVYGSENIDIYPADGDTIVIKEYLSSDSAAAQVSDDGNGKVTVNGSKAFRFVLFGIGTWNERIEIYLPREGLSRLSIEAGSGRLEKEDGFALDLKELTVTAGSGSIRWKTVSAEKAVFSAGSGSVKLEDVTGDLTASAGSGSVTIDGVEGELTAFAGSGKVKVSDLRGGGKFAAGSGSVRIGVSELSRDIEIETNSGSAYLNLPAGASFTAELEVGSGGIHTYFDEVLSYNKNKDHATGQVGNNPACSVKMEAGSGSIHIDED